MDNATIHKAQARIYTRDIVSRDFSGAMVCDDRAVIVLQDGEIVTRVPFYVPSADFHGVMDVWIDRDGSLYGEY